MIAFIAAVLVVVGMSIGAALVLERVQTPAADSFRTSSVRINPEYGEPPKSHPADAKETKKVN
jgi:hypothetical protein